MIKTILFIITILLFVSCTKDTSIEPKSTETFVITATPDTLTHKYILKLQVDGLSSVDSIDFISNTVYNPLGNHYFKRYINPTLSLFDSGFVFGKVGNDIAIIVYNSDTTQLFTTTIFINDVLRIQQVGNTNSSSKKIITHYNF